MFYLKKLFLNIKVAKLLWNNRHLVFEHYIIRLEKKHYDFKIKKSKFYKCLKNSKKSNIIDKKCYDIETETA